MSQKCAVIPFHILLTCAKHFCQFCSPYFLRYPNDFHSFFLPFFDLLIYTNPTILLEAMLKTTYFICRRIMHQSCSIVQNLVVNYHLVISYPQQCHIRININHRYVIIISSHIMLLFVFSRAEL